MAASLVEVFQEIRSRRMDVEVEGEGLRERKKRILRQQISDKATDLFLERGFDAVRVAEVAAACSVSEKTVYNYFPTKESLLLDREEEMADALRRQLGPANAGVPPVQAMVDMVLGEAADLIGYWEEADWPDMAEVGRFAELVRSTPSLRAAQMDMTERLARVASGALAERAGVDPEDPEPQIAGEVMLGLWRLFTASMHRLAVTGRPPAEVRRLLEIDIRRAARVIDSGLWSFGLATMGARDAEGARRAAKASEDAARQVAQTIRQARRAWGAGHRELRRSRGGS